MFAMRFWYQHFTEAVTAVNILQKHPLEPIDKL